MYFWCVWARVSVYANYEENPVFLPTISSFPIGSASLQSLLCISGDRRLEIHIGCDGSYIFISLYGCMCVWHCNNNFTCTYNLRYNRCAGMNGRRSSLNGNIHHTIACSILLSFVWHIIAYSNLYFFFLWDEKNECVWKDVSKVFLNCSSLSEFQRNILDSAAKFLVLKFQKTLWYFWYLRGL